MFTTQQAQDFAQADLARANMAPRPEWEAEPFHFSQEYRDVALRHVWSQNVAKNAREIEGRALPRWI